MPHSSANYLCPFLGQLLLRRELLKQIEIDCSYVDNRLQLAVTVYGKYLWALLIWGGLANGRPAGCLSFFEFTLLGSKIPTPLTLSSILVDLGGYYVISNITVISCNKPFSKSNRISRTLLTTQDGTGWGAQLCVTMHCSTIRSNTSPILD